MSELALTAACILLILGHVWLLVVAFRTSVVWGLACFFIPFAALIFTVMHWDEAANPFFVSLGGWGCLLYAFMSGAVNG